MYTISKSTCVRCSGVYMSCNMWYSSAAPFLKHFSKSSGNQWQNLRAPNLRRPPKRRKSIRGLKQGMDALTTEPFEAGRLLDSRTRGRNQRHGTYLGIRWVFRFVTSIYMQQQCGLLETIKQYMFKRHVINFKGNWKLFVLATKYYIILQ